MRAMTQFSINGKNRTWKLHRDVPGIVTDFSTKHRHIKWADGYESFHGPSGRSLSRATSDKTMTAMSTLAAAGIR